MAKKFRAITELFSMTMPKVIFESFKLKKYARVAAKSPYLNPIKNVWRVLPAPVFKNVGQFATVNDLKVALQDEWCKTKKQKFIECQRFFIKQEFV